MVTFGGSSTGPAKKGDLIVYRRKGAVEHSALYEGTQEVSMAAGTVIYRSLDAASGYSKVVKTHIMNGWTAPGTKLEAWSPKR